MNDPRRCRVLATGLVAGVALTAFGLVGGERVPAFLRTAGDEPAAAVVNGVPIPRSSFEKLAGALASERPDLFAPAHDEARRTRVSLQRVIDEELLFQRAEALDLPRKEFLARKQAVLALVDSIVLEAESGEPSRGEVEELYAAEPARFRRAGRVAVGHVFVRGEGGAAGASGRTGPDATSGRAVRAGERLRAGEAADVVARELGDEPVVRLPAAPLGADELRQYLGPTVTAAVLALGGGEVSAPIRAGDGFHVVRIESRDPGELPALDEIEGEVRQAAKRRAGERALERYLSALRSAAVIEIPSRDDP